MQKTSKVVILSAAATLATACGGGSGSSDDAVDRSINFQNDTVGQYNARSITFVPELGNYSPTEKIIDRTVSFSAAEVDSLRDNADEIGSDHYCDIRSSGEKFCAYMSDDNTAKVTRSVNNLTSEAYLGTQIRQKSGELSEFVIISSDDVSGLSLTAMVPSPTGKIDEFDSPFTLQGDWKVTTASYTLDAPIPSISESEISCSDYSCSGSYTFDDALYMQKSGERYGWTAPVRTDRGEEGTLVGTMSKDQRLMSFFFKVDDVYYIGSAIKK